MKKLLIRTLSAIVFAGITLAALLVNEYCFAAYALFIMTGMMIEFFRMTMEKRYRFAQYTTIATAFILYVLIFAVNRYGLPIRYVSLSLLPLFVLLSTSLFYNNKVSFPDYSHLCTALLYIALPISLSNAVVMYDGNFDGKIILSFFIIIWASDVGAYLLGMSFGQRSGSRKLCPDISPKKSWVGFWGGLFASALTGYLLSLTSLLDISGIHALILGLLMGVFGVAGDLFESMWKRHYGIKDSGTIIPGHGGLLDRFDSSLFAMPVGALYLALFNLL